MKIFAMLLLHLLSSVSTFAGQEGGGGDLFECSKRGVYKPHKIFLVDLYEFNMNTSNADFIKQLEKAKENDGTKIVLKFIENINPQVSQMLSQIIKSTEWIKDENLAELEDDITTIPEGCTKQQLAIQVLNTDLAKTTVYYNSKYIDKLSETDKIFLKLHEAYLKYLHIINNQPGTVTGPVRDHMSFIANHPTFEDMIRKIYDKERRLICGIMLSEAAMLIEKSISDLIQLKYIPYVNLETLTMDTKFETIGIKRRDFKLDSAEAFLDRLSYNLLNSGRPRRWAFEFHPVAAGRMGTKFWQKLESNLRYMTIRMMVRSVSDHACYQLQEGQRFDTDPSPNFVLQP